MFSMKKFVLLLVAMVAVSCKVVQPVIAPQTHDSVRVEYRERVDSVWCDRWHTETIKGDTIYIRDSVFSGQYHNTAAVDSIVVRDSVPYVVEVAKPYRQRNWYDRSTAVGFWALLALAVLCIILKIKRV